MGSKMKRLAVVGGGFAGVWACAAASALRHQTGNDDDIEITLISREPELIVRPRLYEQNPSGITAPLNSIVGVLDVKLVIGEVAVINTIAGDLNLVDSSPIAFDALVLAVGSEVFRPELHGLREHTYDVDSLQAAEKFWKSLKANDETARVAVIGAGFSGLELVTEISAKTKCRTILIDSRDDFSEIMTTEAAEVVFNSLDDTQLLLGKRVKSVDTQGVCLEGDERVEADIVVWTAGIRAHPLAQSLGLETDGQGRLVADEFLQVDRNFYAAGDVVRTLPDGEHVAPMSCQFAIPTGKHAGYNALATLIGSPRRIFSQERYVTCVDLGKAGGLLTQGWERTLVQLGEEAKATKQSIMQMIYPPGDRETYYSDAIPKDIVLSE